MKTKQGNPIQASLLLLILSLFVQTVPAAKPETIQWRSYTEGLALARKDSSFVFIDLYTDWCVPCRTMEQTTYKDPEVVKILNKHFVPVKLNAESEELIPCNHWPRKVYECATETWGVVGVPGNLIIGPSGNYLLGAVQFMDALTMQEFLQNILQSRQILLDADAENEASRKKAIEESKAGAKP